MTTIKFTDAIPGERKVIGHAFESLNLLRGLSAAAVLLSHTTVAVGSGGMKLLSVLPGLGSFAVDVFMLISGFLMMWHFYERRNLGESWGSAKTCWKFYVRRFFRIAPLYYLMLIIIYGFHDGLQRMTNQNFSVLPLPFAPGLHDPTSVDLTVGHVLSHFTFLFGFIPCFAASNPIPDWSIGLEMQFYLFFPFLALLLVRSHFIGGVVLLLAANWVSLKLFGVGVGADPKLLGVFPYPTLLPFKIDCFLAGMLLAAGLFEKENFTKRTFLLLLGLLVAGIYMKKFLLVCFVFLIYELAITYGTGIPTLDRQVKLARQFVEHRIFKFMADTSYGVYLIHFPLLSLVVWLLIKFGSFGELSPGIRFVVGFAVITPLVYSLAFLAYKYVEAPSIALGRKIIKRM